MSSHVTKQFLYFTDKLYQEEMIHFTHEDTQVSLFH